MATTEAQDRRHAVNRELRLMAIGNDSQYLSGLADACSSQGVTIECCHSLEQLGYIGILGGFDAIILDQETDGRASASDIARYVSAMIEGLPVYLLTEDPAGFSSRRRATERVIARSLGTQATIERIVAEQQHQIRGGGHMHHEATRHRSRRRFLLLDDDPDYVRIMEKAAAQLNISITGCSTVDDFILESLRDRYAAAIIDYNIDGVQFKGDELARLVEAAPVFIMSADETIVDHVFNRGDIRMAGFISKAVGVRPILKFLRDYREEDSQHEGMVFLGRASAA